MREDEVASAGQPHCDPPPTGVLPSLAGSPSPNAGHLHPSPPSWAPAHPNAADAQGLTPLMHAAQRPLPVEEHASDPDSELWHRQAQLARLLLCAGAKTDALDVGGRGAQHWAQLSGSRVVQATLKDHENKPLRNGRKQGAAGAKADVAAACSSSASLSSPPVTLKSSPAPPFATSPLRPRAPLPPPLPLAVPQSRAAHGAPTMVPLTAALPAARHPLLRLAALATAAPAPPAQMTTCSPGPSASSRGLQALAFSAQVRCSHARLRVQQRGHRREACTLHRDDGHG